MNARPACEGKIPTDPGAAAAENTGVQDERIAAAPGTLGAVLYPDQSKARESERDWVALVRAVARGDQSALHQLYDRTHRPVFTVIMRLRPDRETAEALTLDVFVDVWRRAPGS